jgi:putative MATE family efflux protein
MALRSNQEQMIDTRQFYWLALSLAAPIAAQNVLYGSLSIVDQLMVGQLGTSALATVGLATKFFGILMFVLIGLTGGLGVFSAQLYGGNRSEGVASVLGLTLVSGAVLTGLFVIGSVFFPAEIMRVFTHDPEVISAGAQYHRVFAIGYFPFLLTIVFSTVLRSAGKVKIPMFVSFFAVLLNTGLNAVLIFGLFGFPRMGVIGTAVATSISRWTEAGLLLTIIFSRKLPGRFPLSACLGWMGDGSMLRRFWATTLPLIATNLSFIVADSLYAAIYGNMGTADIAAISVMFPLQGLIISLFAGVATAAGILLGHELGARRMTSAFVFARRFLGLSVIWTSLLGLVCILLRSQYVSLFHVSAYVQEESILLLIMMAVFIPIKVVNMTIVQGILPSGGETRFIFWLSILGMWGIGLPVGWIAAFLWKLPVYWVFTAISLEELVRVVLGLRKVWTRSWLSHLTHAPVIAMNAVYEG